MMEKRNVLEAERSVCAYCSDQAILIRDDGTPVCKKHEKTHEELPFKSASDRK